MEKSLSTFASEMATSAMILGGVYNMHIQSYTLTIAGLATQKSLVLIDELGRGTSPREGVGISHAIAEGLIALKVRCMFFYVVSFPSLIISCLAFRFFCNVGC
jgi:DNA mismatch repair protein MSH4